MASVHFGMESEAYPTPRSSTDHPSWARTSASASKPAKISPSKPPVGVTTPRTGLHTPAQSLEVTSAAKLRSEIDQLQFETTRCQSINVDVATWEEFEANHRESIDYRTEYVADTQTMIVTCASSVHEGFRALVKPFTDVAGAFSSTYTIETNLDIHITSSVSRLRSSRVPDFVFAKRGDFTDVEKKAVQLLTLKDVQLVACLDITTSGQKPPNYEICDADKFPTQPHRRFDSVIFEEHCWAGAITGIKIHIFRRGYDTKSYDVFPGTQDLEANQTRVGLVFGKLLMAKLEADKLQFFTAEKPFSIDWDTLYDDLNKRLIADGFQRYKDWAVQSAVDPSIIPAAAGGKRQRQASEDIEDLPHWFKKPKTE
ncbi:hypothetical protein C8F04DRAFT_1134225, partial [Mycena alexandri]